MPTRAIAAPEPRLLVGTFVVAFILASSRWGTNIGVSVLFISDVLIAFSLVHLFLTRSLRGNPGKDSRFSLVTPLFGVFFAFVLFRFVLAIGQSDIIDWLRDGVPFVYGIMAFVSAASLVRSCEATRASTVRVFRWALTIHLLWVAAVGFSGNGNGFDFLGPLSSAPVFQIRPDIDVALMAVAAGLNLRQFILGRSRFWNAAGIVLVIAVVFTATGTRAGQIALLLCLAGSFIATYAASSKLRNKQMLMVIAVPAVLAVVLVALPSTTAGARLVSTIAPALSGGTAAEVNAAGTTRARELTWNMVISWTNEEPVRAVVGSGFGNDFLSESGALSNLEGTRYTDVRSPHNWFVGIYARLGILGCALAVLWCMQLLAIIWRRRALVGSDDLLTMSSLTVLAILPVATLGVVLEAPFGAIPFFWAAGVVMSYRHHPEQVIEPLEVRRRTTPRRRAPQEFARATG